MEWDEGRFTLTGSELTGDGLMDDYGNCTFETTVVTGDINSFDVFIDCSNINADQRVLSRIEDMLAHSFGPLDNSDLIAQFIYRNAVDITTALANETAGSGSGDDGMLRARFTKND
jgi:hypothetical protein